MRTEKDLEHECDDDTNCNWSVQYSHQRIGTGSGGTVINIDLNAEKSPGDLGRLSITLTPAEDHQLMLVGKTG